MLDNKYDSVANSKGHVSTTGPFLFALKKELYMIWIFSILAAVAIGLVTLGALSVWVSVLALAVQVLLAVTVLLAIWFIWDRYYRKGQK